MRERTGNKFGRWRGVDGTENRSAACSELGQAASLTAATPERRTSISRSSRTWVDGCSRPGLRSKKRTLARAKVVDPQVPLNYEALKDFISAYNPGNRHDRVESERFRRFTLRELLARDKASLDIFWLRDESLEDAESLPEPAVIAAEIAEDLEAALAQFAEIAATLGTDQEIS